MRAVLQAISEELARLKAEGEQVVPVSEEAIAGLRALVRARGGAAAPAAPARTERPAGAAGTSAAVAADFAAFARQPAARAAAPAPKLPAAPPAKVLPPAPELVLPVGDKALRWAALKELAAKNPVCAENLRPGKKLVLGSGSLDAKILFVGEAPGAEEETQGEPFVGPAGEILTKMIVGMGLKREQVFVSNLVCWRPRSIEPSGRETPQAAELAYCLPFLRAMIEIVQPDLVVALGGTVAQALLGERFTKIGEMRGKWHDFDGRPLMVTYHPEYLLRAVSKKSKRSVWEDLLQVMERAGLPISEKQRGYFL